MRKFLIAAFALTFMVAAGGLSNEALAGYTHVDWIHNDSDDPDIGDDEIVVDDDGWVWTIFHDKAGNVTGMYEWEHNTTPNPADGSSATAQTSKDAKDALDLAKLMGGGPVSKQKDFFETPTGKIMVETGKTGLIIPYHNPVDAVTEEFEGNGGGSGGPDLNGGGIGEQINGNKHKGHHASSDDDDDDDGGPAGIGGEVDYGGASASKEIVNPVPVQLPVARTKKAAHTSKSVKTEHTGKVDALLGKLPSPTKNANLSRLAHGRVALKKQPAAVMHLPSAVGHVGGRTTTPTPLGLAGKLR